MATPLRMRFAALLIALLGVQIAWAQQGQAPDPALRAALKRAVEAGDSFRNRFHAEVWLMDMSRRLAARMPDAAERMRFLRILHYEATRAGLEPWKIEAAVAAEPEKFDAAIEENQTAHQAAGHWGVPLMVFEGEPFHGQDRIDLLVWRMRQNGL